jgi:uncharacterized small protein (DUF1192 family)
MKRRSSPARSRSNGNGLRSPRPRSARPNGAVTAAQFKRLCEHVEQMEGELGYIKRAWEGLGTSREQIEKNGADLGVQFQRIAMMQAEIDRLKANETALQTEINQLRAKNLQAGASRQEHSDAERTPSKV